jgi:hypothetical protein
MADFEEKGGFTRGYDAIIRNIVRHFSPFTTTKIAIRN